MSNRLAHVRAYNRRYNAGNAARIAAATARTKAWRERHPERYAAHRAVYIALSQGRLVRPDACEGCGDTDARLHAHHPDYTAPLDVEWLCPPCHSAAHRSDAPEPGAERATGTKPLSRYPQTANAP